jgi:hypothetical protein
MAASEDFISNIVIDTAMMPEMSEREKALRDLFVREYLQDYNAYAACLRCGFMRSFAEDYAKKFMGEPYVRQQLKVMEHVEGNEADQSQYNRRRIYNALMKEAHYNGPGSSASARVSALAKLAAIEGMDKPAKAEENTILHRGGVMRIPDIADVTEWEDVAVVSQAQLVTDARS